MDLKLYGVIGFPLGHTLSPILHNTAFRRLNLPAALLPWPVAPEDLPAFMKAMRLLNIQGCAVTIPHKEKVAAHLDGVTELAEAVGAVNLIYRDSQNRLWGDNTDVAGFMAPLEKPRPEEAQALILGAGGAARAAAVGLRQLGYQVTVAYVSKPLPESFAARFALRQVPWPARFEMAADLLVNVTPLGMKGQNEGETPWPAEHFAGLKGLAYDIVYTPQMTKFLREARAAGWRTIGGLDMFMGQADVQFKTWTGRALPPEARRAVLEALLAGNDRS